MQDCIFCKIVRNELPSTKLYEDTDTVAFLDISPVNPGHVLVIPREHYENIHAIPDEKLGPLMKTVKRMAGALLRGTEAEGVNVSMSNGEAAGQEVFHAHVHVIPRRSDDGLKHWGQRNYTEGEMKTVAERIKAALEY